VAPQIRAKLTTEGADQAARKRADEVRAALQGAGDFTGEAKKLGLSPVETRMARVEMGAGLPRADSVEETVFSLTIGGVSTPVKSPAGYMVVKVLEHIPAQVPPLAEIRDQVAAAVKREKAEVVGRERAKQIAADAKAGDLASAAKKLAATVGETPRFSRATPADKIPGDVMLAALQAVPGAITEPVKTPQGFYVMKVTERTPADMADLAKERDKVSRDLLMQKQNQAWESWITAARTNVTVEVSPRLATVAGS
jgi:peptidyl-prolyl cis-trans isomerase D